VPSIRQVVRRSGRLTALSRGVRDATRGGPALALRRRAALPRPESTASPSDRAASLRSDYVADGPIFPFADTLAERLVAGL
jgi:hypothetical protein